jgi:tetratricopeptide (TPR) repeat protein
MLQQYKEAIQDCDQALVLDNACAKAFFRKGNALKGLGQLDNALNALSAGLAIDPSNAAAIQDRNVLQNAKVKIAQATEYINTQQYTAAMYLIEQLTKELGAGNREINMMKVKTLLFLKRMEEALNLTNLLVMPSFSNCLDSL